MDKSPPASASFIARYFATSWSWWQRSPYLHSSPRATILQSIGALFGLQPLSSLLLDFFYLLCLSFFLLFLPLESSWRSGEVWSLESGAGAILDFPTSIPAAGVFTKRKKCSYAKYRWDILAEHQASDFCHKEIIADESFEKSWTRIRYWSAAIVASFLGWCIEYIFSPTVVPSTLISSVPLTCPVGNVALMRGSLQ